MLRHCFSREIKTAKRQENKSVSIVLGLEQTRETFPCEYSTFRETEKKNQNTTTATGRKNKTFKKLLDLVLSPALQIFILFTRANKIVVGLVL